VSTPRLSDTSYAVLGLVDEVGPATPYDLKQFAQLSVFNFWSLPHTQLYTECERLAEAGLLSERREESGRRRRIYKLTAKGREALDRWRAEPTDRLYEARDPGTLKLFFGADPKSLAKAQAEAHGRKLAELEQIHRDAPEMPQGMRLALELGIAHESHLVKIWERLRKTGSLKPVKRDG
jgi:PadR family transcriptional regulator AphA